MKKTILDMDNNPATFDSIKSDNVYLEDAVELCGRELISRMDPTGKKLFGYRTEKRTPVGGTFLGTTYDIKPYRNKLVQTLVKNNMMLIDSVARIGVDITGEYIARLHDRSYKKDFDAAVADISKKTGIDFELQHI